MAKYTTLIPKEGEKLDWAMSFQRTGQFPIDRSGWFNSYADAVAYAKGDKSDERGLGGTRYIGQIISVVENDEVKIYKIVIDPAAGVDKKGVPVGGKLEEVGAGKGLGSVTAENYTEATGLATADNIGQIIYVKSPETVGETKYDVGAYIVSGVGTVMKLAQSSASGDVTGDIAHLQQSVSDIKRDVSTNKDAIAAVNGKIDIINGAAAVTGSVDNKIEAAKTELTGKIDAVKVTAGDNSVTIGADGRTVSVKVKADADNALKLDAEGGLYVTAPKTKEIKGETDNAVTVVTGADETTVIKLGIAEGEKVLTQTAAGLKSSLKIDYNGQRVRLLGAGDTEISWFDASAFVKDGMLNDAELVTATESSPVNGNTSGTFVKFTFNAGGGGKVIYLDVTSLIDVYTAGNGVAVDGKTISIKLSEDEKHLEFTAGGVLVTKDIAGAAELKTVSDALEELKTTVTGEGGVTTRLTAVETTAADTKSALDKLKENLSVGETFVKNVKAADGETLIETVSDGRGTVTLSSTEALKSLADKVGRLGTMAYENKADYVTKAAMEWIVVAGE